MAKPTAPKTSSLRASSETEDAALDDLFMDPYGTREPTLSPISGTRKRSVSSQIESDMDMSDCGSGQFALYHRRSKRRGQPHQSNESGLTYKRAPESIRGNTMCVAGIVEAQTDHVRGDDSFLSQEPTPCSCLERTPPSRGGGECESAHTLQDTISRCRGADSLRHTRPHQRNPNTRLESYQKRSSGTVYHQKGHTSTCNPPPTKAEAWSRRFARKPSASQDSMILRARDIPSVQPHSAGLHVGQVDSQEITIQPISSELSYFVAVLPSLTGVQALLQADPRLSGGFEKVIVKQLQPAMWLLTGTLTSSYNRSFVGAPPYADCYGSSDRGSQILSSDEAMSEEESGDESREQFSAKNQRWSSEDDQLLCGWAGAGKPWRWITSQFPMRTPGSVRTRYSMLRRKSSRACITTR